MIFTYKLMNKFKFLAILFWAAAAFCFYLITGGVVSEVSIDVLADSATTTATVGNATPTVGSFNINGGAATIALIEGDSSSVVASTTVTITDDNGCTDLATTTMKFYRTDQGSSCSANGYNCYAEATCSQVGSGNTCDGDSDTSVDYTCPVTLNYFTDPTDANAAASSTNWTMLITADDGDNQGTGTDTIEIESLNALDVTSPIDYGTLALDTSSANQEQTVTNTGNVRLDLEFSGTDMTCSVRGTIEAEQQKYSTTTISVWGDAPYTLTNTSTERNWNVVKRTTATSTESVHWMLHTPASGVEGSCTGANTLTAVNDDQTQD